MKILIIHFKIMNFPKKVISVQIPKYASFDG